MNTLINLIKTDVIKLMAVGRTTLLYLGLIVVFALDMRTAFIGYLITFYALLYTPMAYDEQNNGILLLCILPVTRRQVVQAKYLYALVIIVGMDLIVTCISLISRPFLSPSILSAISALPVLSLMGALFTAVVLPVILYLGATKARYVVLAVYMLGIVSISIFINAGTVHAMPTLSMGTVLLLTAVLIAVSYFIACKLFEKREFTE